jgi:hypothetical protein
METNDNTSLERDVADALRRLKATAVVPPPDAARESALLEAFDAALAGPARRRRRDHWYLTAFAAAAAALIAFGLPAALPGRHGPPPGGIQASHASPPPARGVQTGPPGEFVIVPGAAGLPQMESGTLVRMDVPVSMLPSLGVTPPPGQATAVTADLIVAQDGFPRAVRLVMP